MFKTILTNAARLAVGAVIVVPIALAVAALAGEVVAAVVVVAVAGNLALRLTGN